MFSLHFAFNNNHRGSRWQLFVLRSVLCHLIVKGVSDVNTVPIIGSVQFTQLCPTLCDPINRSRPGLPVHHQLPESTQIQVLSNESAVRIRWPKYCSLSFSISPSSEHPGLVYFRMDWLDPLAVQGTLKGLFQHHNSKASILQHSAFFMVQLSHPYMTTGKTIALTRRTFVDKVMSLLFNRLSTLAIKEGKL